MKTLLSEKPKNGAWTVSLSALGLLALVFTMDQQDLFSVGTRFVAEHHQIFDRHEYWRAFTALFMHADLGHLAANSFFFVGLSYLLYGYFGFWAFPGLSLFAGAITNLIVIDQYPSGSTLVGASGVVYFMASFWLTLYFFIQRQPSATRRIVNALAISLALLFPQAMEAHVSYLSHAVGFALGIPFGLAFFLINKKKIRSREVWFTELPEADPEEETIRLVVNRPSDPNLEMKSYSVYR